MHQTQQREVAERMSWARALVFGVGFFFLAAILMGQLPSYVNLEMTSSITGLEQALLALAAVGIAGFIIIQVIVLLFDPKPLIPPVIFIGLGVVLALAGLTLIGWAVSTVHQIGPGQFVNNQYFPQPDFTWNSLLGGKVLWFEPAAFDFVMTGFVVLLIGLAMVFYGTLARGEQSNPDRRDLGTTFSVRLMLIIATILLLLFTLFITLISDRGLAYVVYPQCPLDINPAHGCPGPITGLFIVDTIINIILGVAVFLTLGAFALRLHYLMRPVRKRTMNVLYIVGINLAQVGVIALLAWILVYPVVAWIHSWSFIGLGDYLIVCGKISVIPGSCTFSQQAGYIVDTLITSGTFVLLVGAIWAWKGHRNLVIVGGVTVTAVLALATLLTHLTPHETVIAMLLAGGILVLAVVWTGVARREFAVVGEKNLGCLGMWLVLGTCLLIYLAAFAFFSIPSSDTIALPAFHDTETNVPFTPGLLLSEPPPPGQPPAIIHPDAAVMFFILGVLAAIQFYFLLRNRYKI
jgi:hypothetical protein